MISDALVEVDSRLRTLRGSSETRSEVNIAWESQDHVPSKGIATYCYSDG